MIDGKTGEIIKFLIHFVPTIMTPCNIQGKVVILSLIMLKDKFIYPTKISLNRGRSRVDYAYWMKKLEKITKNITKPELFFR